MKPEETVIILLATYNGGKYLSEQIESVLRQTYSNWKLIIRDDNSSDKSREILSAYQSKNPDKIFLMNDDKGNLGSVQNFNLLLQQAKQSEYIMFCDQDDVWLPTKMEDTLNEMLRLEDQFGKNIPLLVHTNFQYADEKLNIIKSKQNFEATKLKHLTFANVLAQNPAYGCTMMFNKQLGEVVNYIPEAAENHDYWIILVAAAFGKIAYLKKKTILYRQHSANLSTHYNDHTLLRRFKRIVINKKNVADAENKIKMAIAFKNIYAGKLATHQKKIIEDFLYFSKTKSPVLLFKNLKNGLRRQTAAQTLLFYATFFAMKKNGKSLFP